jgi:hypothetical protein
LAQRTVVTLLLLAGCGKRRFLGVAEFICGNSSAFVGDERMEMLFGNLVLGQKRQREQRSDEKLYRPYSHPSLILLVVNRRTMIVHHRP